MTIPAPTGFVLDVPESEVNRAYFDGPANRVHGHVVAVGFPRARVVTMVEAGTRAVRAAAVGTYTAGERDLVKDLVGATGPHLIVIMDRGFPGCPVAAVLPAVLRHRQAHHPAAQVKRDVTISLRDRGSMTQARADAHNVRGVCRAQ
jgi:hypothetical protein